jgi:hypothetical protein
VHSGQLLAVNQITPPQAENTALSIQKNGRDQNWTRTVSRLSVNSYNRAFPTKTYIAARSSISYIHGLGTLSIDASIHFSSVSQRRSEQLASEPVGIFKGGIEDKMKSLRRSLNNGSSSPQPSPPLPGQVHGHGNPLGRPSEKVAPPQKVIKALASHRSTNPQELSYTKGDFWYVTGERDGWFEALSAFDRRQGWTGH